jgi:hypothetical protein
MDKKFRNFLSLNMDAVREITILSSNQFVQTIMELNSRRKPLNFYLRNFLNFQIRYSRGHLQISIHNLSQQT